jgi:beta propeller domain-containing protein
MRRHAWLIPALLALIAIPPPAGARTLRHRSAADLRPRAFASCADLIGYADRHFAVTHGVPEALVQPLIENASAPGQPSAGGLVPAPAAPTEGSSTAGTSYSTTNDQETGVDEPDIVKTDGSTIFAVAQNRLYAVAVGAGAPRLVGSLDLGSTGHGAQLLLRGTRLIVISGGASGPVGIGAPTPIASAPAITPSPYYYAGQTVITEVDVHDPSAMKVARTMTIAGTFVDARQNGSTARVVISSAPRAIADPALRARASGWLPTRRFHSAISGRRYVRAVAACNTIRRPVQFSGLGMLTILTIDLDRGLWATDSEALMADAQVVYGSQGSLYIATQRWIDP